ncbi:recombinase zinc beta ribbon domain-containing protein [Cutibacterium sp.]|uniref:recombinase zinc beta ribbon domain-containing protein n=1 Tax=Cutibacterium sp. TaxID=1912221 RepID=UPI0034C61CB3
MTSKIKCAACGCSFVRTARKPRTQNSITTEHWICTERKKGRATSCSTSEISDTALKTFIATILGIDEFDDDVFTAHRPHRRGRERPLHVPLHRWHHQ